MGTLSASQGSRAQTARRRRSDTATSGLATAQISRGLQDAPTLCWAFCSREGGPLHQALSFPKIAKCLFPLSGSCDSGSRHTVGSWHRAGRSHGLTWPAPGGPFPPPPRRKAVAQQEPRLGEHPHSNPLPNKRVPDCHPRHWRMPAPDAPVCIPTCTSHPPSPAGGWHCPGPTSALASFLLLLLGPVSWP